MADSFHRIMRDLRNDHGFTSKMGVAVAAAFLLGWLLWAFTAHVTSFEVSDSAHLPGLTSAERTRLLVIAQFKSAAFGRIRPGQRATFRLDNPPSGPYGLVSARVIGVAEGVRDGRFRVDLSVTNVPPMLIQRDSSGSVEVETERATPASLLLRSAGVLGSER